MNRSPWQAPRIQRMAHAYWETAALYSAVKKGVLARLTQGPALAHELASDLKLDPRALGLLLTSLTSLGLLIRQDEHYALDPTALPFFTPGGEGDMSHAVLHLGNMMETWSHLDQSLVSGRPAAPSEGWDSAERRHFYRAMRDIARQQARGLAARLGLQPGRRLLDLGGGPGVYAYTFCSEVPGLSGTVFDLPQSRQHFEEEGEHYPARDAVRFEQGDYLKDPLGGPYDVVWISQVLHSNGPDACQDLVAAAARDLAPGGALFIQEFMVDYSGDCHPFAALFGLNMLINTPEGQVYSPQEIGRFMTQAGLRQVEYLGPTKEGSPASLIKAMKP